MKRRIAWAPVIERAAAIVRSYRTAVTLRQVFYRLVSEEAIPNTENAYKTLSRLTGRARRAGTFPALADATREVWHHSGWTSPQQAIRALAGYESETLDRQITTNVQQDGRPAVVVYAGDLDPSGEDIWRSFLNHTGGLWDQAQRVAVTWEQVETHQLPVLPGKTTDSRAKGFAATHGRLAQIEVEALDPNTLHNIYTQAINLRLTRFGGRSMTWDCSRKECSENAEDESALAPAVPVLEVDPPNHGRPSFREVYVIPSTLFTRTVPKMSLSMST